MSSNTTTQSPGSDSPGRGTSTAATRALAVVTNRWYREQRKADQEVTKALTLLKQRKISCLLKVGSVHRILGKAESENVDEVEKELEEVERRMVELEKEREDRFRKIMDRRVQQVTTLQELGLLEAVGKETSKWHSESDLKDGLDLIDSSLNPSPLLGYCSTTSICNSSISSKHSPRPLGARLRSGSDPSIARLDPSTLPDKKQSKDRHKSQNKGLTYKLSPRLGRRNPLRMLSNAIDFRSRQKQRPKSADFENIDGSSEGQADSQQSTPSLPPNNRSSSVTDISNPVSLNLGHKPPPLRILEGRNSAPDMLSAATNRAQRSRNRNQSSNVGSSKQKLSTRFQTQRKQQHRAVSVANSSVRRAKTFSGGGVAQGHPPPGPYKTLPKQGSSHSLGSSSIDSSTGSQSTTSSRKSSNSSSVDSDDIRLKEISKTALEEIAAFEKFIEDYFENCDKPHHSSKRTISRMKPKVSVISGLSEVLELSI